MIGKKVDNKELMRITESEEVVYDSGMCWVTFLTEFLSGPEFIFKNRKRLSRGRLILTENRILAIAGGYKVLDVERNTEGFDRLSFDNRQEKRYEITVNYNKYPDKIIGKFTISYHIKSSQGQPLPRLPIY